jgi:threonine dehydrogenase-like Zn-dependent dehydrogenase
MAGEIVFTALGKAELQAFERRPLGTTEVCGPTCVTLISPGTELAWLNGGNYPLRPGYAAVFEADEIGDAVSGIVKGDLLLCMGPHRSVQQFDQRYVLKLPKGLPVEKGVIARLAAVSVTTLMTTTARPHDMVLVCGAGPVGYLAAHLFQNAGYRVTLVEPNEQRQTSARQSGIANVLPSVPVGHTQYDGQVALVLDCSGHEQAVIDGCKIVRKRGEVVLVGVPWKAHTTSLAHELMHAVFFKFAVLRSGWEWEVPVTARGFVWEELYEGYNNAAHSTLSGLQLALDWIAAGKIPLDGLIAKVAADKPQTAYDALMKGEIGKPFVVLDWAKV